MLHTLLIRIVVRTSSLIKPMIGLTKKSASMANIPTRHAPFIKDSLYARRLRAYSPSSFSSLSQVSSQIGSLE